MEVIIIQLMELINCLDQFGHINCDNQVLIHCSE